MTISGAGSALVAVAARVDAERVGAAMAAALSRSANPAAPLAAAVAAQGLTRIDC